ncbi:DNA cytosine methyltransferase [Methanoregula sp.]|uniref:DNA cytosine methyltransferase n=1 Tax=Methanoregula sp. TaxID=2052170 RepID=UPI00236DC7DF|nr:DNA cytosine methyltransferase [Methanoregula sp.]MDD1685645.1 DNA cytosine methyltransferase [Methanoregula sp.]
MAHSPKLNYIDLFSGCGGLSLGLYNAGWNGLFAIEKNPMAFATLKHNLIDNKKHFHWPSWLEEKAYDINDVLKDHRADLQALEGKVDLIAGGPPCQGFSFAGKRDEQDHRNQLVNSYLEFVKIVKPKMIFFENVRGFTSKFVKKSSHGKIFSEFVKAELDSMGYNVKSEIINFSEYGVPQRRQRFILVGVLRGDASIPVKDASIFFRKLKENKESFLKNKGLPQTVTAKEAISDLERHHGEKISPDTKSFKAGLYGPTIGKYQEVMKGDYRKDPDSHRFVNHRNDTMERFQHYLDTYPRNKNIGNLAKENLNLLKQSITIMDPGQPSPTLTTLTDDYIHYSEPRVLTVREFARLQSFNDWFEFKDKYTTGGKLRTSEVPRYTQVGNAIPPLFVEQAGRVLKAMR